MRSTKLIALALLATSFAGCGYPAYGVALRSNFGAEAVEGKCKAYDDNEVEQLEKDVTAAYAEGWRLALVNAYTSTAMSGHSVLYCYERAASSAAVAPAAPATK